MSSAKPLTFTYKTLSETKQNIDLDVYLPQGQSGSEKSLPTMIWFHGGGGFAGDKGPVLNLWFPHWAADMVTKRNDWIFISANYRLLGPSTGYDQLEDIKDVFKYVAKELASKPIGDSGLTVDTNRLMTGGDSYGGYVARQAAIHAEPKPKAMLSMYGMGGQFLTPFYTAGRTKDGPIPLAEGIPLFPLPNPAMEAVLHPSEVIIATKMGLDENGIPLSPRLTAFAYAHQLGVWLDYLVGKPGFSSGIEEKIANESLKSEDISADARVLFPELAPPSSFPRSILVHGGSDGLVLPSESSYTASQLSAAGVETLHIEVPGGQHGFEHEGIKAEDGNEMWQKMKGPEIEAFLRKAVASQHNAAL